MVWSGISLPANSPPTLQWYCLVSNPSQGLLNLPAGLTTTTGGEGRSLPSSLGGATWIQAPRRAAQLGIQDLRACPNPGPLLRSDLSSLLMLWVRPVRFRASNLMWVQPVRFRASNLGPPPPPPVLWCGGAPPYESNGFVIVGASSMGRRILDHTIGGGRG